MAAVAACATLLSACASPTATPVRPLSIPGQPPPPPVNVFVDGDLGRATRMDVFLPTEGGSFGENRIDDVPRILEVLRMLDVQQPLHEPTSCDDAFVIRVHVPGVEPLKFNVACAPPGEPTMLRGPNTLLRGGEIPLPEGFADAVLALVDGAEDA